MKLNAPQFALLLAIGSLVALGFFLHLVGLGKKLLSLPSLFKKEPSIKIAGLKLRDSDRLRHTHILGATGSGKTVLLESLIYEDLARGYGMFIIDPKGDRELFDRIKDFCKSIGRESDLHFLSANFPQESVRWNPCRLGIASEIQSKFINSWDFSEIYYAKSCEAVLLEALNSFGQKSFSLSSLTSRLKEISEKRKDDSSKALFLDLFNTIEGEWGELLCGKKSDLPEITLLDVMRKNEILFIDLPTEGKSVQSTRIGKLLLQEIILISGMRKTYPSLKSEKPFSIYVDEFDAFATQSFATFLNKGRSSGFMIHISHQTLSDLIKVDGGMGSFLGQIQGNINNRFFFRIDDPKDAETIASFFGTKKSFKTTSRLSQGSQTGDGSIRETHEFQIHPDTIKNLDVGSCIFSSKTGKHLSLTKIPLPSPKKYFKPRPLLRDGELQDKIKGEFSVFLKKGDKTCAT